MVSPAAGPAETYLDIEKLIGIAKRSGADAVHPGYGFLSERAEFARAVIDAGLIWIGPDPHVIEALGDKVQARRIATSVGAPLVAGSDGPVETAAEVIAFAEQYGLPVAIKAAHGGGGRGLKVAWKMEDVADLYASAVREAEAAFGRGECFLERFLDRPRHIEAQVLADKHGNVLVLGTRDCSLQRRNQKLVEEAPAPFLSDAQRHEIHDAARRILRCRRLFRRCYGRIPARRRRHDLLPGGQYPAAGGAPRHRRNDRHRPGDRTVPHRRRPAAAGDRDACAAAAIRFEFRINAEDPGRGFLPTPGTITTFEAPSGPGVRLDSGVVSGSTIPGTFDSLMAKLIVTGATREQALTRARRALKEFRIEGVATVLPFHRAAMEAADFIGDDGFKVHTRWIETDFADRLAADARPDPGADTSLIRTHVEIDGKRHALGIPAALLAGLGGLNAPTGDAGSTETQEDSSTVTAPISGTLQAWKCTDGDTVKEGDLLAVMEAMKMETQILSARSGKLVIKAAEGAYVNAGAALGRIE